MPTTFSVDPEAVRRVRYLREVLDAARFGRGGTPDEQANAAPAAEALLELGFPYAFELEPEELSALRDHQAGRGSGWFRALAICAGVLPSATAGVLAGLIAASLGARAEDGGVLAWLFGCSGLCSVTALVAGADSWRLAVYPVSRRRAAARGLVGCWLVGLLLLIVELGVRSLAVGVELRIDSSFLLWFNAFWLAPLGLLAAVATARW